MRKLRVVAAATGELNGSNITPILRNQVIGLGADALLVTFDPRDHLMNSPDAVATGVAYECAQ